MLHWCTRLPLFLAACIALPTLADDAKKPEPVEPSPAYVAPKDSISDGIVTVRGHAQTFQAVAGTLLVEEKDRDRLDAGVDPKDVPQASMFYVAYFKRGPDDVRRPLVFLYNGGPGSASVWLHMGAFGPVRVTTENDTHTPAAPYRLINNESSLLDAADLVFIDAPGTGFSRILGKGKEKAFLSVDGDANAFSRFIVQFLTKYGRWNSPKYLFGESYGTTRSAVVALQLQDEHSIDVNGIILLSQVLNFETGVDAPQIDPGNVLPYVLALPSYAATAWYHKSLAQQPEKLEPFLEEVERFAEGDYARALAAAHLLPPDQRVVIREKLHRYTGLPESYIDRANLRIGGGQFSQMLQVERGLTTGRMDSRFSGIAVDVLDKQAAYDPLDSSIGPAYVAAFNDYCRKTLKFGEGLAFHADSDFWKSWDFRHKAPGSEFAGPTNVLPDLALTMKRNPQLKVLNLAGYFDLATPFFAAQYELRHLPIPAELRQNIESIVYPSGHMIYAHLPSLTKLHDDVAAFIRRTAGVSP